MNNSDDEIPPPPPPLPPLHLPEIRPPKTAWWMNWKIMVPVWLAIGGMVWLGLRFNIDHRVIAGVVVVIGVLSNAFAWLVGIVALVPIIGPLIVKVLSIGFIWLLNAIGYLVALVAIRRGYSKDVLTYRGLTVALIIGIVIGYIIGRLV
ncbi:MAG TPA: hypothetical protein VEP67_10585 [Thiobacillaceae bacterium]|nr:hypothetical protein [Thiobacillaceae bacterium]